MILQKRCPWAKSESDIQYHDNEWGKPVHDDLVLFEFLILEGMQAGLSWSAILKKRENFRQAFDGFNPKAVAAYTDNKITQLLTNQGIIRNRLKIKAAVSNAKAFLEVQNEFGTFDSYIWSFVGQKPIINSWKEMAEVPAKTDISDKMSNDLKKRGFQFTGSVICYSFMQAVGMVNDHLVWCEVYDKISA